MRFEEGQRVRYTADETKMLPLPDGIVEGDEGIVLAPMTEPGDGFESYNVEFPESPFRYAQVDAELLEEVE